MPPITLTKPQFLQTAAAKKPGASYAKYVNYVTRARAARPAAVTNVMQTFAAGLTPAMQHAATSSVSQQIADAMAANTAASKVSQAQEQAQANRAQGFALALNKFDDPEGKQALADYQSAAGQIQGFGTGLTGALAAAQKQQADKTVSDTAALTGGLGSVAGYNLDALHNDLQYGHVTLPATSLAGQAADAAITARGQAAASAANVGSIGQQYLAKLADTQNQLTADNATLQAKRPELVTSALTSMSDAQRQQRALDVQVGTLQLQTAKTVQDQAIAMTNLTGTLHVVNNKGRVVDTGRTAAGSTAVTSAARTTGENTRAAADRKVRLEIANAAAAARVTAAQTTAAAKVTAAQTAAAAKKAASSVAGGKPATAAQRSTILKNTYATGGDLVKTTLQRIQSLVPNSDGIRQGEKPADFEKRKAQALNVYRARLQEHRGQIVSRVAALITPQLQLLHYGPDQIAGMANAIVTANIPAPGH